MRLDPVDGTTGVFNHQFQLGCWFKSNRSFHPLNSIPTLESIQFRDLGAQRQRNLRGQNVIQKFR
jgi:hypothetical protein